MLAVLFAATVHAQIYYQDRTWAPAFPTGANMFSGVAVHDGMLYVTQRGNTSIDPVLVMSTKSGALQGTFGSADVGTSPDGKTWGAHGIGVAGIPSGTRVFINDFNKYVLTAFDSSAESTPFTKSLQLGTPGVQGNGTNPVQFGHLADTAVRTAMPPASKSRVFVSDGDGGSANRVVALEISNEASCGTGCSRLLWATPSVYYNPHSIAFHARTGMLLIADREHNHTRLIRADDGKDLGVFDCGHLFGKYGKPFGVRFWASEDLGLNLAFVAVMDNPQDGRNQQILVMDVAKSTAAKFHCDVVEQIDVPPTDSGPHLLGVDSATGDVYAALVADRPRSWVLRYRLVPVLEKISESPVGVANPSA